MRCHHETSFIVQQAPAVTHRVHLEQRLRQWNQAQHQQPLSAQEKREVEQPLHELETAIGSNVESVAKKAQ